MSTDDKDPLNDVKKELAHKTLDAYWDFAVAGAVALPLIVGGPTGISTQQPIRKPDEHLASQLHADETIQEAGVLEAVGASANLSVNVWDGVKVSDEESAYIQTYPPKTD